CSRCIAGISRSHGSHQVAQKFSSTTCPRSDASEVSAPPGRSGSVNSGATLPRPTGSGTPVLDHSAKPIAAATIPAITHQPARTLLLVLRGGLLLARALLRGGLLRARLLLARLLGLLRLLARGLLGRRLLARALLRLLALVGLRLRGRRRRLEQRHDRHLGA